MENKLNQEELWILEDKIEEINIFIKEFKGEEELWNKMLYGFSTEASKYKRLVSFLNRLIDLEKEDFKRKS
jgi:hypothetical protein